MSHLLNVEVEVEGEGAGVEAAAVEAAVAEAEAPVALVAEVAAGVASEVRQEVAGIAPLSVAEEMLAPTTALGA